VARAQESAVKISRQRKAFDERDSAWRDPAQVVDTWDAASVPTDDSYRASRGWWDLLSELGISLVVTREYEHLVVCLAMTEGGPRLSCLSLPHPSGVAVNRRTGVVTVASTRNPNRVFDFLPVRRYLSRGDAGAVPAGSRWLMPARSRFFPGSLYLHDLAWVGGRLMANAVGHNLVVSLDDDGRWTSRWWPRSIERNGRPRTDHNYLQLNSIAAGRDLAHSFFTASAASPSSRRPGHRNFPVDGRGVVLSGASREPVAFGLTRPHSARLHEGRVFLDNSGYGELGLIEASRFVAVARLPGWTRGLCFKDHVAFVGTSQVLPRFSHYAPGIRADEARCGVYAVDAKTGKTLESVYWPRGNQVFAVDWLPAAWSDGFPFVLGGARRRASERAAFYTFDIRKVGKS
jgi:uncharacterized protein (TIGR03032 family)